MPTILPPPYPIRPFPPMNHNDFLNHYSTRTGRWLANRLGLAGPKSERLANLLSNWAWNRRAADACARPESRRIYMNACGIIRAEIESNPVWQSHPSIQRRIRFW